MKIFALEPTGTPLGTIGGGGLGPFGRIGEGLTGQGQAGATEALQKISNVISSIIGIMTVAAGIWFIFQFLVGGFNWITSSGDKAKLQQARDRLTNAFIGLIVVVAGWAILSLAGQFFGIDFLISSPGTVIENLFPGGTQ